MQRTLTISIDEIDQWKYYLSKCSSYDIFYDPNYYLINSLNRNYKPEVFVLETEDNCVFFPYMKINISDLPFYKSKTHNEMQYWDIVSLEYGGPIAKNMTESIIATFEDEFSKYCIENNIISGFIRLHPFYENYKFFKNAKDIKEIHYVDLSKSKQLLRREYNKSNRNCINKAEREGVKIIK